MSPTICTSCEKNKKCFPNIYAKESYKKYYINLSFIQKTKIIKKCLKNKKLLLDCWLIDFVKEDL